MRISTKELALNLQQAQAIDPKIQKLINSLADKPLLLEKIVANQQTILLQLNTGSQKLQLQLPASTAQKLSELNLQQAQINVTASKQTITININPQQKPINSNLVKTKPNKDKALGTDIPTSSRTSGAITKSTTAATPPNTSQSLVFRQALLLNNQPTNIALSKIQLNPASDGLSQKEIAAKPTTPLAQNAQVQTPQVQNTATQTKPLAASGKINSNHSQVDLSSLAKSLIQPNYAKPKSLAAQLNQVLQTVRKIQQPLEPNGQVAKLLKEVKNLLESFTLKGEITAQSLKQRVINSGLFFENKAQDQATKSSQLDYQKLNQLLNQSSVKLKIDSQNSATNIGQSKTESNSVAQEIKPNSQNPNHLKSDSQNPKNLSNETNTTVNKPTRPENQDLKLNLIKIIQSIQKLLDANSLLAAKTNNGATSSIGANPTGANTATQSQNLQQAELSRQLVERQAAASGQSGDEIIKSALKSSLVDSQTRSQSAANLLLNTQQLQSQLRELMTEVKSILSKLETHQLMSIKNDSTGVQQFLFDLPILKNAQLDSFEMRFEQQSKANKEKASQFWKVVVRFDLEPLGPMFAQVELKNDRISTHIFAQSAETANLIENHLDILRDSFTQAGINSDRLEANQGKVPETLIQPERQGVDIRI